jgi:hypothetical protein
MFMAKRVVPVALIAPHVVQRVLVSRLLASAHEITKFAGRTTSEPEHVTILTLATGPVDANEFAGEKTSTPVRTTVPTSEVNTVRRPSTCNSS